MSVCCKPTVIYFIKLKNYTITYFNNIYMQIIFHFYLKDDTTYRK